MTQPIPHTGGCQCGIVRFALTPPLRNPHICHCRMCQKAFGNFFAALVAVERQNFAITRGQLSFFRSSDNVDRGFCANCGTPLSFEYLDATHIAVSIGALDHPEEVVPKRQYGVESRLPYIGNLIGLEGSVTEEADPDRAASIAASTHQHPDHDTMDWQPHPAHR